MCLVATRLAHVIEISSNEKPFHPLQNRGPPPVEKRKSLCSKRGRCFGARIPCACGDDCSRPGVAHTALVDSR